MVVEVVDTVLGTVLRVVGVTLGTVDSLAHVMLLPDHCPVVRHVLLLLPLT